MSFVRPSAEHIEREGRHAAAHAMLYKGNIEKLALRVRQPEADTEFIVAAC